MASEPDGNYRRTEMIKLRYGKCTTVLSVWVMSCTFTVFERLPLFPQKQT
jgi:hypothetical protein